MNRSDIEFFEAYKRLDKLCGEILNCSNGVSEYISEMERSPEGQYKVASWNTDYKELKHIKWVRNQIAHDATDFPVSDESDILFAESFYDRILNQDDPFARLRKSQFVQKQSVANHKQENSKQTTISHFEKENFDRYQQSAKQDSSYGYVWMIAVGFLLLFLYLICRY